MNRLTLRGRRRWLALAVPLVLVLATVAWALLSADSPLTGSASGEDATAATEVVTVAAGSENNARCAWTRTADGKISLVADRVPAGVETKCSGAVQLRNAGNVELRLQGFSVTTTAGTVRAGFGGGYCGLVLAPGATIAVEPRLMVSVPVGQTGTLTGKLTSVDSASYSSGSCPPVL